VPGYGGHIPTSRLLDVNGRRTSIQLGKTLHGTGEITSPTQRKSTASGGFTARGFSRKPLTARSSPKETCRTNGSGNDMYVSEARRIGVGAGKAAEIHKAAMPLHEFESWPVNHDGSFTMHEDYGGHKPKAPKNMKNFGRTFGTNKHQDWRQVDPMLTQTCRGAVSRCFSSPAYLHSRAPWMT